MGIVRSIITAQVNYDAAFVAAECTLEMEGVLERGKVNQNNNDDSP